GCYHAGTWRLNLRCIVSSAISQCSQALRKIRLSAEERRTGLAPIEQWSGGRPRPPTPLATNEPDAYCPPRGCARGRTALCLRRLPTPTAAVRLESKWEIRRAETSLFNSQLCD